MKFDKIFDQPIQCEDETFVYNHARCEYLAGECLTQYEDQMEKICKKYKKAKKRKQVRYHALNMISLHSEWHVEGSDETLYLIYNKEGDTFTDIVTENEYYSSGNNEEDC